MSPTDSKRTGNGIPAYQNVPFTSPLSLNDIFKDSIRKVQAQYDQTRFILRCENLPFSFGKKEELEELFRLLLSMIPAGAPGQRVFLHVDCVEQSGDVMDLLLEEGLKRYVIRFHTNISTDTQWESLNQAALAHCRQILSIHRGSLQVNQIAQTGYLFCITLPGKIQ
jgi:hypothetical protein